MITIYKYEFRVTDYITIDMPKGAEVLHVDIQYGKPCIWATVDTDAPTEKRSFRLYGTGHPIQAIQLPKPVGSFQMEGGALVFHLFEIIEKEDK